MFSSASRLASGLMCRNLKLRLQCLKQYNSLSQITGTKLFYEKVGSGPHVVVCVPGVLGTTRTDFHYQLEGFDPNIFTTFALDLRGCGRSKDYAVRDFSPGFYDRDADDVAEFINNVAPETKVSLLGWSDGGISALILAAVYPHLVEKLVVWGASAYYTKVDIDMLESIRDLNLWSSKMRKPMVDVYGANFKTLWNAAVDGWVGIGNSEYGDICRSKLKDILCPTLILHGNKDPLVRNEHPEFLRTNIKGARLFAYPDGKHNIHMRYKDDFNTKVTQFISL